MIDAGWDLLTFAQQASDIAAGNLRFRTIPTRGPETNDRGDVVLVDEREVHDFVERSTAEQQAAAEAAADAPKPPPPLTGVIAERYVVDVRNASETVGLAAAVAGHLRNLGFIRGTVDNTGRSSESVIRYTGADGDAADALAEQLGGIGSSSPTRSPPGTCWCSSARIRPGRCRSWPRTVRDKPPPTRRTSPRPACRASTDLRWSVVTLTAALLDPLRSGTAGARPLITFYDDATGERIELSAVTTRELGRQGREPAARRV